jgi:aminoethylphosphonate catabolism LysR family transcriptional regulator
MGTKTMRTTTRAQNHAHKTMLTKPCAQNHARKTMGRTHLNVHSAPSKPICKITKFDYSIGPSYGVEQRAPVSYSQLKAFHSVALHGGFSRASEKVFITQPALSEHVRRLEQDHDTLLFRREKKRVTLTDTGAKLFELTKQLFEVEDQINDFLSDSRAAVEGELRITVDSASHISEILGHFQTAYPNVFISMRTANTEDMIAQLRAYNTEIAIAGGIDTGSGDLIEIELGAAPIVVIAAKGYLPAKTRTVNFAELTNWPMVFREQGSKTRQLLEREATRRGFSLTPAMEVEGREAMRDIVASGAGIGFISSAEFGNDKRLKGYPINDAELHMQESLLYLAQRSNLRIIRTFVEFARSQLNQT